MPPNGASMMQSILAQSPCIAQAWRKRPLVLFIFQRPLPPPSNSPASMAQASACAFHFSASAISIINSPMEKLIGAIIIHYNKIRTTLSREKTKVQ